MNESTAVVLKFVFVTGKSGCSKNVEWVVQSVKNKLKNKTNKKLEKKNWIKRIIKWINKLGIEI